MLGSRYLKILFVFCMLTAFLPAHAVEYGYAPVSGQMTSMFGWRTDPFNGNRRFHGGIDIAAASGMPVYAPQNGVVMYSGYYGGYGNVVVLHHGNGLYTLYGHNSRILVNAGQSITRGQSIALVGSTGRSTGPHLHFEVHYNGQYVNPLTYLSYLQQQGFSGIVAQANPQAYTSHYDKSAAPAAAPKRTTSRAKRTTGRTVQLVNGNVVQNIRF